MLRQLLIDCTQFSVMVVARCVHRALVTNLNVYMRNRPKLFRDAVTEGMYLYFRV